MIIYDCIIIGAGPAGLTFATLANKNEKIKVVNYNIDRQISILKEHANRTLLDSNYYLNNLIKSNIDSINALKNKYTFDINTLKTYNIKF